MLLRKANNLFAIREHMEKMMNKLYEELDNKNIDEIVEDLIEKLKELLSNTAFSFSNLLGNDLIKIYNSEEFNKIAHDFIDECYKLNIDLDFPNPSVKTGQFYTIQYIKK